jgi:hypothetical protein
MIEARVTIDRKFMKKTARMLSLLACAGALCLGGCISPDLEPPGGGGNRLPSAQPAGTPSLAERAAAAGTTAAASTTPSNDAATKPAEPNAPTTGMTQSVPTAGRPAAAPGGAAAGSAAPSTTSTGAAGAAAGASDDADAGVGNP